MPNPVNAGPSGDGSRSLAKESKAGIAVQWVLTTGAIGLAAWLENLDTSHWSGWWAASAITVVGAAAGLCTAYYKRNR